MSGCATRGHRHARIGLGLTAALLLAATSPPEDQRPVMTAHAIGAETDLFLVGEHERGRVADTGIVRSTEDESASADSDVHLELGLVEASGPRASARTIAEESRARAATQATDVTFVTPAGHVIEIGALQVTATADCGGVDSTMRLGELIIDGEVLVSEQTTVQPNTRVTTGGPRGPLVVLLHERREGFSADHGVRVNGVAVYSPTGDVVIGLANVGVSRCPSPEASASTSDG